MNVPRLSFSLSLKTDMPFRFKPAYRWSVNFVRVSSPLKLRKTSYLHLREEEDDDEDWIKAMKEMDAQRAEFILQLEEIAGVTEKAQKAFLK